MTSPLALELQDHIGLVTLNQPDKHNCFDDALIAELTQALESMAANDAVRVVVLSAAGKSFSAGADLAWMKRMAGYSREENLRDAQALAKLLSTIHFCPKPVVARVQGPAYGGGVGLIAACDIAIGMQSATFSLSEVKLGIIPAVISPYVIAAIGRRAAHRYFLTAERFDAAEAYRIGLLHDLVQTHEELDDAVGKVVDALLISGPRAQHEAKQLIHAVADRPIDDAVIADTAERIARVRASVEGKEGITAFLEKRSPNWIPKEQ